MKLIKFLVLGIVFGIILSKAEIISWYRIYEMFRFESFHMYGIIGSAVILGIITIYLLKYFNVKTVYHEPLQLNPKRKGYFQYIVGGTIFGLGWAMTGACPGPMFILLGRGVFPIAIVILSAMLGTYVYGVFKDKLPH